MPLIIPPGFAQVSIEWAAAGDPDSWFNTFGIDLTDLGGDVTAAAEGVEGAVRTSFLNTMSNIVTFLNVHLVVGQDGAEPVRYTRPVNDGDGNSGENKLPQNCALLVKKQTNLGGRRNSGRMFIPGIIDETVCNNIGQIDGVSRNAYQGLFTNFMSELAGPAPFGPTPMVILHSEGISDIIDPTPVTSLFVDSLISTQRNRLR